MGNLKWKTRKKFLMQRQLTENNSSSYYEPCAGTGGILIDKWYNNFINDPVGMEFLLEKEFLGGFGYGL